MDLIGGRWELLEPIASGGSSTVWRAFDHQLGLECAAKVLRQRDAGQILRFAREQSVRPIGDHLVAPYGWVADDGTALIAFELITGGSLGALVGDYGPLGDTTVTTVLDQLLSALGEVHATGIVHRDLKPANVLLRATGTGPLDLALTDFGIAISFTDARLTMAGTVIGTPGYLPPEVLSGHASPEPAHDLYALGRLAVALILGHEDGTTADALELVSDPALAKTIARLTADDPLLRPSDVGEVRDLLRGAVRAPLPCDREGEPIVVLDHIIGDQAPALRSATVERPNAVERAAAETMPGAQLSPSARGGMRRRTRIILAATIVAAVAVPIAIWTAAGSPPPSIPVGGPSSGAAPQSSLPDPSAPAPGDACTWLTEGDVTRSREGGWIECRLIDGEYVWQTR